MRLAELDKGCVPVCFLMPFTRKLPSISFTRMYVIIIIIIIICYIYIALFWALKVLYMEGGISSNNLYLYSTFLTPKVTLQVIRIQIIYIINYNQITHTHTHARTHAHTHTHTHTHTHIYIYTLKLTYAV